MPRNLDVDNGGSNDTSRFGKRTKGLAVGTGVTNAALPPLHVSAGGRCRLEVISGPDKGRVLDFSSTPIVIGRSGANFQLTDSKVSPRHAEIDQTPHGYRLRDLGSTHGTHLRGVQLIEGYIHPGVTVVVGRTAILFTSLHDESSISQTPDRRHSGIVGDSPAIRDVLAMIERLAPTETTVLIHGETGTGKELVAEALHRGSRRAQGPFVVLDCSAIPEQLFEDQLFGHESGSFTGASQQVQGVFESAHGGTIFLDEIGELPLEMQSRLLRVLEARQFRRIGGDRVVQCDVRVVAATHRNLALEVNRGGFRADLYYRLAVAKLEVPALRDRKEDLELLIEHFYRQISPCGLTSLSVEFFERAHRHSWPGNIRELRNAVERALLLPGYCAFDVEDHGSDAHESTVVAEMATSVISRPVVIATAPPATGAPDETERDDEKILSTAMSWAELQAIDLSASFKEAKQQFVDAFDRQYLRLILHRHKGNISAAARAAGMDRMTIYKLLRRLNMTLID